MRLAFLALTSLLAPVALVACEDAGGCTEIGCSDGLFVDFDQPRPGAYDVSLVIDGQATSFICEGGQVASLSGPASILSCSADGFVVAGAPARVELNAGAANLSWQAAAVLEPTYQPFAPNGAGCPPVCDAAEAALETTDVVD